MAGIDEMRTAGRVYWRATFEEFAFTLQFHRGEYRWFYPDGTRSEISDGVLDTAVNKAMFGGVQVMAREYAKRLGRTRGNGPYKPAVFYDMTPAEPK